MSSFTHRRAPRLAALTLSLCISGGAVAQSPLVYPNASPLGDARAAQARSDPAEALARYLRVLASNPRSLEALTGAGRAALDIEDPNAAVGFYGRAEEVAPRDGRVKAGLASALVQLEQPAEALRLFQAAVALGVSESSIAGDRGLAYDLRGDNRRAQADYQLSLRSRYDPEVARRLAVSQAIGGDRAAALQTLDPLLRQQNKAAWRTRAFVHALTGDAPGAAQLADTLMLPMQAAQMKPFLSRLAGLSPSAKAMAVHFGHFPNSSHGSLAMAQPLPVPGAVQQPLPSVSVPVTPTFSSRPSANTSARRLSVREQRNLDRVRQTEQLRIAQARDAEQRRLAQEAEQRRLADARLAEERRLAQLRLAEQQRVAEQARFAEQARMAEQARLAEQRRVAEAQEAERRAAASRAIAARPIIPAVPQTRAPAPTAMATPTTMPATTMPMATLVPSAVSGAASGATGGPLAPVGSGVPRPSTPEPAFASLANVLPAADQAPASPVRAVELPASAAAPSAPASQTPAVGPAPLQLASAPLSAATPAPGVGTAPPPPVPTTPRGDVPRVEIRPAPKPAGAPATDLPVLRTAPRPKAAAAADVQPKRTDEKLAADVRKSGAAKEKTPADAELKGKDALAAKADKAALAKKDAKGAKAASDAKAAEKDAKSGKLATKAGEDAKAAKAKTKEPARVWVQVAGGADKNALPREWGRLKARHGDLFAGQSAWTTPLRATNRLLVGPFKSFNASQEFVNKAGKAGLPSFTFTSDEGQAIEKLAAK